MMLARAGQRIQVHLQKGYLLEKENKCWVISQKKGAQGSCHTTRELAASDKGLPPGFMVHRGKPRKLGTTPGRSRLGEEGDKPFCLATYEECSQP